MHFYNFKKSVCNSLGINVDMVKWLRNQGAKIGENCEIHQYVDFGSEPYLITIGNHVRITNGVRFFTHEGGIYVLRNLYDSCNNADEFAPITVGSNVHIGVNALIMSGVNIGDNCIIGAGAVVTHDVSDNSVVVGVPAKKICSINDFYFKHMNELVITKNLSEKEKKEYLISKILGDRQNDI